MERKKILQEFLDCEFKAMVIAVDLAKLDSKYLGRIIDHKLIEEFEKIGIDPSGENGEYHTVVFDGLVFKSPLILEKGKIVVSSGYCFLDVSIT